MKLYVCEVWLKALELWGCSFISGLICYSCYSWLGMGRAREPQQKQGGEVHWLWIQMDLSVNNSAWPQARNLTSWHLRSLKLGKHEIEMNAEHLAQGLAYLSKECKAQWQAWIVFTLPTWMGIYSLVCLKLCIWNSAETGPRSQGSCNSRDGEPGVEEDWTERVSSQPCHQA